MHRFSLVLTTWFVSISLAPLLAQSPVDRDVSQLKINGLETISAASVLRRLENLPEIFEASHHTIDQATYVYRVREAVIRGMLSSGFLDAHVEVMSESSPVTLLVDEGPRFRRGAISVEGGSDEVNQWVSEKLEIASTTEEDADPVWKRGKPAVGTLFGNLHHRQSIQERLDELGLHGSDAEVEFRRDDASNVQQLQIELDSKDASFTIPVTVVPGDQSEVIPAVDQPAVGTASTGIAGELRDIHQRLFAKPTDGIRFRCVDSDTTMELWIGEQVAIATVQKDSHHRSFVLANGDVLISMSEPPAAIRLPIPNPKVVVYLESAEETEDGKTIRFVINGAFSSKGPGEPGEMGVVFSADRWAEWFPPDVTQRTEDSQGVLYSHQDYLLRLDRNGQLIELSGPDVKDRQLILSSLSEGEVEKLAGEINEMADPIELFVRDPDSDRKISLKDIFEHYQQHDEDDDELRIPPSGGQRDVLGVAVLAAVNDGRLVDPDSLLGRLSKLYALELSRNRRGLPERIRELEGEALGPVTSAVLADLLARQGRTEPALRLCRESQRLAADPKAVQHDVQVLVDSTNLIGRVCQHVDIKRWLQQATQLAAPGMEEKLLKLVQGLVSMMPDATNEQERLANARRVVTLAYELTGRTMLDQYLTSRIATLQAHQERLAKKKKAKEKR